MVEQQLNFVSQGQRRNGQSPSVVGRCSWHWVETVHPHIKLSAFLDKLFCGFPQPAPERFVSRMLCFRLRTCGAESDTRSPLSEIFI
jgi:hypothetical protein